jgi:GDP-D-mannose dehydratase
VRAIDVRRLVGDPTKLHATLGSLPEYALEETLAWMLNQSSHAFALNRERVACGA